MAQSISIPDASKLLKEIYGDGFLKACPIIRDIQDAFPFEAGDEPGRKFVQAQRMTEEQGFTMRKAGTEAGLLRQPIALKVEAMEILGSVLEFRSRMDIDTFKQAMTSKRAFKDAVGLRQEAQRDSIVKHLEWSLLCGGLPVGVIQSIAAGGSAVQKVLTITAASWPGGFFAASENMPFDIYDSTSATLAPSPVKRNTSSTDAAFVVNSYDLDARTVTMTANAAGDWTNVVAGDCLWRVTSYLNEAPGLIKLSQLTTGVVNGIDASAYGLWRGLQDNAGGNLTMDRILKMLARIAVRSNNKAKFTLRLSPLQFTILNTELHALRKYEGQFVNKVSGGFAAIEYYAPNGTVQIMTHPFMPDGIAHLVDDKMITRRGPSDIDFTMPGAGSGEFYLVVQDRNAVEYRAYSNQALLNQQPSRSGVFTGLTVPS